MNPGVKVNILLIEDNPGDVNLVKLLLKDSSVRHELFETSTFFDGTDFCKNNPVDLVLLDLSLPDSSGFKTLSSFLEKNPQIPVIVLTGINNEIVGNQAVKAGAQDFLVKGQFDGKQLGRSIRYSLQRFKTQIKLEQTAKTLSIAEKRYVEAQEMANFGNWTMDIVSNKMEWTNEVFRIFGFHPNSISPTLSDYLGYVHMEDKPAVEAFFEKATKEGKPLKLEHKIVIEGRNIRYVVIRAKINYEEINGRILLVGAIQDITERKLSEKLIIEKNLSDKTSKIKEEALEDLSFHIRTPLSSIVNLTYLIENSQPTSEQMELVNGLKTSVDDLSIMINNLLNFSFMVSDDIELEEERINPKEFFTGLQKVLKIKADNLKVKFNHSIENELPEKIISDSNKLTQIIINLSEFAFRTIKEANQLVHLNIKTLHIANSDEHYIEFTVRIGDHIIDQKDIQNLLESERVLHEYQPQKTDSQKQEIGFAIGLKLIKLMGGNLDIKSTKNIGTEFTWGISVKGISTKRVTSGEKPDIPIKVLLVEDHFLNQIATKKVLTTWSEFITVDIAENGLVGLEKFREHGYDIILMDLQMPVMGGLEATEKIRKESNVPIIALTAHSSKQEEEKCRQAGIDDYLSKPFKPEELQEKIMNLLVAVAG